MDHADQAETPTRPTRRPYALPLENGLRRVRTNSIEHDALVAGGYVLQEQDPEWSLLRMDRRTSERRERAPQPPRQPHRPRLTTLLDHRASIAAFHAVEDDAVQGISYGTVCLVIETFLAEREALTVGKIR